MDFGLHGKTALVLGGGGGLGRAIAKSLAGEGANVAIAGIGADSVTASQMEMTAIGVKSLKLPSMTSTPMTIGSFLLNTATGLSTHGKTASSLDIIFDEYSTCLSLFAKFPE